MSQADKHTWMCTWMHKQKCVRRFRPCHCVVNHKNIMSATELPQRKSLLKLKSLAEKPQGWWTKTTAFMSHLEVASGEKSVAIYYSPGCNGLLLPCEELVLEDLEDLLLVGRLLLPVKVITGGSTAAGGTCTTTTRRMLTLCILYIFTVC